jgi:hypothetical protein
LAGILSFEAGCPAFEVEKLSFEAGVLTFEAGILSSEAGVLTFPAGSRSFEAENPRLRCRDGLAERGFLPFKALHRSEKPSIPHSYASFLMDLRRCKNINGKSIR